MKKKVIWGLLIVVLIAVAAAGIMIYQEYSVWNTPWGTASDRHLIDIPEGWSARQIGTLLEEKGIIDNVTVFLVIADLRGIGDSLKAGEYEFTGDQTPYQALDLLATGWNYRRSLVIPEGFTQLQIAQRCEEMEICTAEAFIAESNTSQTFAIVVAAPDGTNAANEGVFFPDTYFLIRNTPPIKVVERMVRKFEKVFNPLFTAAQNDQEKSYWWKEASLVANDSSHSVIILASIIEKEAKNDEDRAKIAAVFVNRLRKGMPLQSDSTVHYSIQDWSRALTLTDLEFDSPYNTYQRKGLPPAAICNPGEASLRAAMEPTDIDALYFIAMNSGETKFTADYNEFLKWKREYKNGQ
ncbi:MAG: endolytic transglycosylase MltG [Candidatus Hinthialibacter antarcticus]|nr:endolytic transglycosylase MltG [Candidatus Hinthialibacter antarcticus]